MRLAWRVLPPERRLSALAAVALFATLFLPWYQETVIPTGFAKHTTLPNASLTGWAAFSFVEAAVLLVSLAVLALLFFRAEGRAFHVPGGDGGMITVAGFWTGVLILWRMFDKSGTQGYGQFVTASGIEWGIFIALGVAGLLAYSGQRIRLQHEAEPPLPGERPRRARRRRGRPTDSDPAPGADLDAGWLTPDAPGRRSSQDRAAGAQDTTREHPGRPAAPARHPPASEAPTVRQLAEPEDQLTIPLDPPQ